MYWYGYSPPASNLGVPAGSAPEHASGALSQPSATLLGRDANLNDAYTSNTAPSWANGIDFAWFLPLDQAYDSFRGCYRVGRTYWTAPPVAYAYTTDGYLNSPASVLTCPRDSTGFPLHFNHLTFSWALSADGTDNVLTHVTGNFNNGDKVWPVPRNLIPQPPTGSDGLQFGFHHDNYQSSQWTQDGVLLYPFLSSPGHTRMATWQG